MEFGECVVTNSALDLPTATQNYITSCRKSTQHHQKWCLGVAWEALGRGRGGIGPPRRAKGRQTLVRWLTLGSPSVPLWGHFFSMFLIMLNVSEWFFLFEALRWRLLGSIVHGFGLFVGVVF